MRTHFRLLVPSVRLILVALMVIGVSTLHPTNAAESPNSLQVLPAATSSFINPAVITINDAAPGTPYPSSISVSGITDPVAQVTVTVIGVTHTFPGDFNWLLVGPGGQNVLLTADCGGGTDVVGATYTFQDGAAIQSTTSLPAGTYRPTECSAGNVLPAPAPTAPYGSALSVFNGTNPNGVWSLYIFDDAGADIGSISGGWSITISDGRSANPPNEGLIKISTSQTQIVYQDPGGAPIRNADGGELFLPHDADSSGYDTYQVVSIYSIGGEVWVGIFLGGPDYGYVRLADVTPLTPLAEPVVLDATDDK